MTHTIHTIEANSEVFAYYTLGEGSTVFCFHGFPDSAHGFLPVAEKIAASGYRVIVPFMRGYKPSSLGDRDGYSVKVLANDVLALIDALADGKATVIGHDWGGLAAYVAAIIRPEAFEKLVVASVPHMAHAKMTFRQLYFSWYVLFFQLPWLPEKLVRQHHYSLIDLLYKRWSPQWQFSKDNSQPVKNALCSSANLHAALGYYRAMGRVAKADYQLMQQPVTVPTLVASGEVDGSIDVAHFEQDAVRKSYPNLVALKIYPGIGHFPHRESPDQFSADVIEFLGANND